MHGKALKKPIPIEWYLWDGTEETAAHINAWAAPENRTDTDVWFCAITSLKGTYIYGDIEYNSRGVRFPALALDSAADWRVRDERRRGRMLPLR
jgi:hypothetical protein